MRYCLAVLVLSGCACAAEGEGIKPPAPPAKYHPSNAKPPAPPPVVKRDERPDLLKQIAARFEGGELPATLDKLERTSTEQLKAIARGEVLVGMTRTDCLFSWGYPAKKEKTTIGSEVYETWRYEGSNYLEFHGFYLYEFHEEE